MKKVSIAALLISLIVLALVSCKKDGNGNSSNGSESSVSLLTKSRWSFLKGENQKSDGTWIQVSDAVDVNYFTVGFNTNNTLSLINNVNGGDTEGGWSFTSNNTVLTVTGTVYDLQSAAYTVNTLTTSTLVITWLNYPQGAGVIDERLTFTH